MQKISINNNTKDNLGALPGNKNNFQVKLVSSIDRKVCCTIDEQKEFTNEIYFRELASEFASRNLTETLLSPKLNTLSARYLALFYFTHFLLKQKDINNENMSDPQKADLLQKKSFFLINFMHQFAHLHYSSKPICRILLMYLTIVSLNNLFLGSEQLIYSQEKASLLTKLQNVLYDNELDSCYLKEWMCEYYFMSSSEFDILNFLKYNRNNVNHNTKLSNSSDNNNCFPAVVGDNEISPVEEKSNKKFKRSVFEKDHEDSKNNVSNKKLKTVQNEIDVSSNRSFSFVLFCNEESI